MTRKQRRQMYAMDPSLKPVLTIPFTQTNQVCRAQYWEGGSGYVEVRHKGKQIFCEESGTARTQWERLQKEIERRFDEIQALEAASYVLEDETSVFPFAI